MFGNKRYLKLKNEFLKLKEEVEKNAYYASNESSKISTLKAEVKQLTYDFEALEVQLATLKSVLRNLERCLAIFRENIIPEESPNE